MNNMSVKTGLLQKREIRLILILLALVILVVSYVWGYTNFSQKAEDMQSEINELKPRLAELREHEANINNYRDYINTAGVELSESQTPYPNDVRSENFIMYSVQMENNLGIMVSSASFAAPSLLLEFAGIRENGDGSYSGLSLQGYLASMSLSATMTYEQMKSMISFVYRDAEPTAISSLSISYDSSTGALTGSVVINKYFITGIDDSYNETNVPRVPQGTDNLFSTIA